MIFYLESMSRNQKNNNKCFIVFQSQRMINHPLKWKYKCELIIEYKMNLMLLLLKILNEAIQTWSFLYNFIKSSLYWFFNTYSICWIHWLFETPFSEFENLLPNFECIFQISPISPESWQHRSFRTYSIHIIKH